MAQKHLFSIEEEVHYLNNAYKGPLLKSAEEALVQALIKERNPYHIGVDDYFEPVEEVRLLFSQIVSCSKDEVAFLPSSSYGFASVLSNVKIPKGQHALTIEQEFPSDYFAIKRCADDNEAELKIIQGEINGKAFNQRILDSINQDSAVLVMSSIHWMNGTKFDLEAIGKRCKECDCIFVVDGTQSVGMQAMDVKKYHIDALICAAYKWLFGPYSTALAYISPRFHQGKPIEESWMNRNNAKDFKNLTQYDEQYAAGAARFNVGERSNFLLIPILKTGLRQVLKWKEENIQAYISELANYLREGLKEEIGYTLKGEYASDHLLGIYFHPSVDTSSLKAKLSEKKIIVSERGTSLRVALHVYNDKSDIDALLSILNSL